MSLSIDQKRTLAIDLGLPAVMILLWMILPSQIYQHLYYTAHILILTAILPVNIYAALALREQGKRTLCRLAAGTCMFVIVSIAVIRYLDAKLMGKYLVLTNRLLLLAPPVPVGADRRLRLVE